MTTIQQFLGTKDSARIGNLYDKIDRIEYKLVLKRHSSDYNKYNPVIVNSKGRSDTMKIRYSPTMDILEFQQDLQQYLEIDNPGRFQVIVGNTTPKQTIPKLIKVPKPKRISHNFQIGDIVCIKMRSGDRINRGMVVIGFTSENNLKVYPLLKRAVDYADFVEGGLSQTNQIEIFDPAHTVKDSAYFTKKGYDLEKIKQKAKQLSAFYL